MISLRMKKSHFPLIDDLKIVHLLPAQRILHLVEVSVLLTPFSGRYSVEDLYFHVDNAMYLINLKCVPEFVNFCNKNTGFYDPHLLPHIDLLR